MNILRAILSNWTVLGTLRFAIAIIILAQAFVQKDITVGLLGSLLLLSAVVNIGCCGAKGCKVDLKNRKQNL